MDQAQQFLARAQNPDGGWGYQLPGDSFTEPTSLGLIAVLGAGSDAIADAATAWLLRTQRRDGGWGAFGKDDQSGWQTAFAVWALSGARAVTGRGDLDVAINRGGGWLISNRSRSLGLPNPATRLQGRLTGWSWTPGTFGWVIPTALALVALRAADDERATTTVTTEAISLLKDRGCQDGGWNWGNPVLFGTFLPSYATETSIAVLGLLAAGEAPSAAEAGAGLDWLAKNLDADNGVAATAWALIALGLAGRAADGAAAEARLRAAQTADGGWRSSPHATALAVIALGDPQHFARGRGAS
jgi:squalene cyclase